MDENTNMVPLSDNAPLLYQKGHIQLIKDFSQIASVPLDEIESISNSTYSQIIQESFAQNRGVIIARVQTRDRVNIHKCYYHYFLAANLVQILFKKPMMRVDDTILSRYHPQYPMTVKNPLTNEIIVGEVEFYLIKNSEQHELTDDLENIFKSEFIGTDYNYALSKDFRQIFLENSLENDQIKLQIGGELPERFRNDPQFTTFAQMILRGSASNLSARVLWSQVQMRRKNITFHGAIFAFFIIASVTSIIFGIKGLAQMKKYEKKKMNFDIFTYTLPFVAFILDHSVKKIKGIGERSIYILIKLVIIIYYLGAYVLALQSLSTYRYYILAHINFIIYPIFATFYGHMLRKKKFA